MKYTYDNAVEVEIPLEDFQRIGIRFSGGADSAILMMLLAETIMRLGKQKTAFIQPMTVHWEFKPFNHFYGEGVRDFICSRYPEVDIRPTIIGQCDSYEDYIPSQVRLEQKVGTTNSLEIIFGGVTMNPPASEAGLWGDFYWNHRDVNRDPDTPKEELFARSKEWYKCFPFRMTNKRGISKLYEMMGVLDTLYPITWSCEAYPSQNEYFQKQCGVCWWCKERIWGFGKLI